MEESSKIGRKTLNEILESEPDEISEMKIQLPHNFPPIIYGFREYVLNRENYVKEQLEVHKDYSVFSKKLLNYSYQHLNEEFELDDRIEDVLEYIPEKLEIVFKGISKAIVSPILFLKKFQTIDKHLKQEINKYEIKKRECKLWEDLFAYGERFVNFLIEAEYNNDELMKDLSEWHKTCDNLVFLHSRLGDSADKMIGINKKFYNYVYPDSKI